LPSLRARPATDVRGAPTGRAYSSPDSRIDPETGKVIRTYPTASHGMQAVGYGALWVGNSGDSTVWRDRITK